MIENTRIRKIATANGFSLLEILVVILILGVLSAMAIPGWIRMQKSLRLSGDADASVAVAIESALRHAVLYKSEVRDVDVVLGDVTYLDARVVGVLLGIGYELRKQQRALRMVSPSQSAARLFGILGLDRVLDIRDPDAA